MSFNKLLVVLFIMLSSFFVKASEFEDERLYVRISCFERASIFVPKKWTLIKEPEYVAVTRPLQGRYSPTIVITSSEIDSIESINQLINSNILLLEERIKGFQRGQLEEFNIKSGNKAISLSYSGIVEGKEISFLSTWVYDSGLNFIYVVSCSFQAASEQENQKLGILFRGITNTFQISD